jgi:thiol-disulfide isomerase/thioredoxin
MKRNWIILAGVLVAIVAVFVINLTDGDRPVPPTDGAAASALPASAPKKGSAAPAFELQALDDETTYRVGGPRDKALLVNFWASWCGPCEQEAPDLVSIYDKYKDKLDLYAVNATSYDKVRNARVFVEENGFRFPVLMDTEGKVVNDYLVANFPTSFIIDRNGQIVERIEGIISLEQLKKTLDKVTEL